MGELMMIREAKQSDLNEILQLYLFLHKTNVPQESEQLRKTWDDIINDENHHLIICEVDGKIVASCVCICQPIFRSYDHRKLGHLTSKFSVGDSDAFMFNYYYIQYSP